MALKRRCPVCQSRKWHKEPSSGLIVCSEGHVMQNYRNEAADEEIGPHALRKRTLKVDKKPTKDKSRADPKLYHGARGHFHFYQCQQLILRHQVSVLIKEWELPPEFEAICRDVWALHLALLRTPPPAEPYFHSRSLHDQSKNGSDVEAEEHGRDVEDPREYKFAMWNQPGDGEEEPELAALLRENSELSSIEEGEEEEEESLDNRPQGSADEGQGRGKKRDRGRPAYEGLQGALSVLIFALWTMRVPIMYSDIISMIEAYKLPYFEGVRLLPREMTLHLTKYNLQSLSPGRAPQVLVLHALVSRLARRVYASYKVLAPEVNGGPLLWRVVRRLGGTPMLYTLTKRLGDVLSLPLTLHPSLSPELARLAKSHPESHKYDSVPPELAFSATAIIVLKMVYGLDRTPRVPQDGNDPASWLPRLEDFIKTLKAIDTAESEKAETLFSASSPMPVNHLSDEMLDKYLEFCQRSLTGERADTKLSGEAVLNRFFPLTAQQLDEGECSSSRIEYPGRDLHANLASASASCHEDEQKPLRPAELYTVYHARDVFGSVGEEVELLVDRVGRIVGVSPQYVMSVVENYERRVARRWKGKMRMRGGQEDILDDDADD